MNKFQADPAKHNNPAKPDVDPRLRNPVGKPDTHKDGDRVNPVKQESTPAKGPGHGQRDDE